MLVFTASEHDAALGEMEIAYGKLHPVIRGSAGVFHERFMTAQAEGVKTSWCTRS